MHGPAAPESPSVQPDGGGRRLSPTGARWLLAGIVVALLGLGFAAHQLPDSRGPGPLPGMVACPAIGFSNGISVRLSGDTSAVASVVLEGEGELSPVGTNGELWGMPIDAAPEVARLSALDADGATIAEAELPVAWAREDGWHEECPAPYIGTVDWTL